MTPTPPTVDPAGERRESLEMLVSLLAIVGWIGAAVLALLGLTLMVSGDVSLPLGTLIGALTAASLAAARWLGQLDSRGRIALGVAALLAAMVPALVPEWRGDATWTALAVLALAAALLWTPWFKPLFTARYRDVVLPASLNRTRFVRYDGMIVLAVIAVVLAIVIPAIVRAMR